MFALRVNLLSANGPLWFSAIVVCLCGGLGVGCGGKAAIAPDVPKHKRPVSKIVIKDNQVISDESIEAGLVNREPSGLIFTDRHDFSPGELARDAERIQGAYRQQGYFDAKVRDIQTQLDRDGHVQIVFTVEEGNPVILTNVHVDWLRDEGGNYEESTRQLRDEIGEAVLLRECCREDTRIGDLLDHPKYLKAKRRLRNFFLERGYAHADVDGTVRVDRKRRQAEVEFVIDPGPRVRFGKTSVLGTRVVPESVVLARLAWEEGEIYSPELIERTRGRLLRLGHFSNVDIDIDHSNRKTAANIKVTVAERQLQELRLGGGAAADAVQWEIRGRAEYTKTNVFFDPRTSFHARFKPAYRWLRATGEAAGFGGSVNVSLDRIDLVVPLLTGTSELSYELERFESYTVQGPELRLALQRPFFNDLVSVGLSWNILYADFLRLDDGLNTPSLRAQLGLDRTYRLGYYRQAIALDTRDTITSVREGFYVALHLEEGTTYAGGNYNYISGEADVRGFVGLGDRVTLAARSRYSHLLYGDVLPITRRYLAGGASSHRGFSQRRLTPVMGDGTSPSDNGIVGATRRLEASFEVRIDVYPFLDNWIKLVPFIDAGDVTENGDAVDLTNLHWAAGLGLRIGTPVGPLRFDVGYRLNRYSSGEPAAGERFAFHVSLGEAF